MLDKIIDNFIPIDLTQMRFPGFMKKRTREIKQCVDNVRKTSGLKNVSKCPICSSGKRKVIFSRFGICILRCARCGVGYPEKFPKNTSDIYSHKDYLPIAKNDYLKNVDYRKKRFAKERLGIIKKYLDKPAKKIRLLDVGTGTGWFLEEAKKAGFNVFGQELGKELADFTSRRLNIKVWGIPFTKIPGKEKFDVITLFDVIEHVPNPKEVVKSIKEHLASGGIALIFTPNLDSFCLWNLKEKSTQVMPVEHLFYFSRYSLGNLFKECGLRILKFETKGMDIPDIYSYYSEKKGCGQIAGFLKQNCSALQAIIDASGYANHMRFIVKKS